MPDRVHNFCAGPCTLPLTVLEEVRDEFVNFKDQGMSLIEMSHRAKAYDEVHVEAMALALEVFGAPEDFGVMFIQGGATLQFAMVPMNLLNGGRRAAYVVGGSWGKKALADGKKVGEAYAAWSGADDGFTRMPAEEELALVPETRYLHITSNETIGGIRLPEFYQTDVPMVGDMSSDYLSRPIPWERFDVVYGGAQKNLGPAGMAVVFVRTALLESIADTVPAYLSYRTHHDQDSLANTPPMFTIWATNKVLHWMKANGGVVAMQKRAEQRSSKIYRTIDEADGFYRSPVDAAHRSHTNIVFRLADEGLEATFISEAEANQFENLKGHRSVGGMRASIYNGLPDESVDALVDFMSDFARRHG